MSGFRKEIHGMLVALVMTKTALKEWFLEGSSGERTVNLDKTIDDSIKQLSSLILMLKGIANSHLNGNSNTLLAKKAFGIQSI
ncbi:hypothetical protein J3Q64DRAFT_1761066 [Phycomyces blakesleeanus]|uniref:Uncharacterized protein n=2 Tax=Phycomyces blakesleeanus TaxID=4837 RepID=A0A162NF13_PHYB8|nr:hypothetical protein PHYBLDRAFT_160007 [Phycomyces blakesleeanus NRRL 1555(-)]OAD68984.1 hypothetical protein PHYBLDRAFT_160007 [Phycomyces blakesleeanus NRRL 1555(-)]|eukprot:XP_018287024.1 hypothetical protein PHYBLDRAFT_160007 [Phycomyces blakesleeanus NRRL 1555(-)]